ncbi:coiled-coil domain-containing protein 180 [Lycodopsis pacificus]
MRDQHQVLAGAGGVVILSGVSGRSQVQLSRSLMARHTDRRTALVDHQSSDIIERLTEKKTLKHKQALKQLETELTHLSQVCETQVRTVSLELLYSLQDVDLRLNPLKDRMEQLDHVSGQEVCLLWEEVQEEVKMKKIRINDFNHKLIECETQRTDEIRVVLRKYLHLLENISFLPPPDVYRLIHTEAMMLNQSLLVNRRSAACLLLLLQEENLQQESLLRLQWEEHLSLWRRTRVGRVVDRFRSLCSRDEEQQLVSGQLVSGLTKQRDDVIDHISSLVPPFCSTALVSDWFDQLAAVNQQIDDLHTHFVLHLRLHHEQSWSDRLAEVELCEKELSALQLSQDEVNDVVGSQLLTVIGRSQSEEEERLAAVDRCCDSEARCALGLTRCVFVVMRGAALLWETHSHRLERRREELEQHLDDLRQSQQKHTQSMKVRLDHLLCGLRQGSSEEALKTSLDETVSYLQVVKHSCTQCVSDQSEVLDHLPLLLLEELLSYSSSLTSFYHLDHTYRPSPEELENLLPSSTKPAVTTVKDRKEAAKSDQELQLKELNYKNIQTHVYQQRLAELQLHRQQVDLHCEEVSEVLTSCRVELQEVQTSISRRNQEFSVCLSVMEDVLTADSSRRLKALSSTLQDRLDQHIKDTQCCQTAFRQTVHHRLDQLRTRTTRLLNSFRLFSEGGDIAPQELRLFQKRLEEETRQISVMEESIYSELEGSESQSLQQLKEASAPLEEKLCFLKSEVDFIEKIQEIMSSTQVHIKAEAYSSKQQQVVISSMLEDLRMMENTQVSPDQVCSLLSSVNEELRKCCQYLDFSLGTTLSVPPKSRKQVRSAPPPGLLQTGVDLLDDPVVGVIKSLNRFSLIQDDRRPAAGVTCPVQQKCTEFFSTPSMSEGCRSIRTERRFQIFGPEPEQNPHSFSSTLNSVLWRTNDVILQVAEDFYQRCGLSKFLLLPDSLDQWAESMQQRLLGYQEQTRTFLCTSREELATQRSLSESLLLSLPEVLISNHEQRQGAELIEEMGRVRVKLEETLAASEEDKRVNIRQLRVSLRDDDLQTVNIREELRQQQLQNSICSLHLELQVGGGGVSGTPVNTKTEAEQHYDVNTVTTEMEAETGNSR